MGPGSYWLTIGNAVTTLGWYAFWDENFGPSSAVYNSGSFISGEPSTWFLVSGHVPEPMSLSLFGAGLLGFYRRRRLQR